MTKNRIRPLSGRLALVATVALAMAALAAAAGGGDASAAGPQHAGTRHVTVMTRNLYLGTPLQPILGAPSLPALFGAVAAGYANVQASNFPERAQAIADEIATSKADLVALQEAMLYRTDVPADGPATPAENVTYDFLELLRQALEDRGESYDVVATTTGTDAELPAGFPPSQDVRLTDRIAVLSRRGHGRKRLELSNVRTGTFAARLVVPTAVGPLTIPRGWISVDVVKKHGAPMRFVATHLEAFQPAVQVAQGAELLAGPANTSLPVVIAGDLNSRADGLGTPTYANLLAGGFEDAWTSAGSGPGLTCCHPDSLVGTSLFDKRIDFVLTRGLEAVKADVLGEEEADRTASGLWPSDHAGVVARLRLR